MIEMFNILDSIPENYKILRDKPRLPEIKKRHQDLNNRFTHDLEIIALI